MKFDRRNFLRSATLLAACSLTEIDRLAAKKQLDEHSGEVGVDDETYWKNVRQLFPLDNTKSYLNNGTMGPSPYPVINAINKGMWRNDFDAEYGGYEKCVAHIARFVKAGKDEIALTHNVTEGINIACWGLPLKKRDEVILTTHEHVGNALPWLNRQTLHGIVIRTFTPGKTAAETLENISKLINKRTRAIAVPHIPCTQGQVLPVKEICQLAKNKGLYSCIDGAHGMGMLELDLHDMGCDTYATCSHKWLLGPKGAGFLYVRKDFQDTLQPYFVGGGGDEGNWDVTTDPAVMADMRNTAHRYFGGTQSLANSNGTIAAIEFMESIGMANVQARVHYLGKYTQEQLLSMGDKVKLLTPTEERSYCGINGFNIKGIDSRKFMGQAMDKGVRIRFVPENGLNSLRVSTHIYNNKADIDAFMALVKEAIDKGI